MADLTTLYRGQPWYGPSNYLRLTNQGLGAPGTGGNLGLTRNELSRLAGQYWTTNPRMAEGYGPKIRSMKVPSDYLDKFKRFEKMVTNLPSGKYRHAGLGLLNAFLVPKSTIKNVPSGIDLGKTLKHQARGINYPLKGLTDELRFLKSGWDIMGDDYTFREKLKGFAKQDLAPLFKKGILKSLGYLGSLPASAALMTLSPTKLGSAEMITPGNITIAPQKIKARHAPHPDRGGDKGGGYQPPSRAQNVARTSSRVGPGGKVKAYGLAHGGLIDIPLSGRSRYI